MSFTLAYEDAIKNGSYMLRVEAMHIQRFDQGAIRPDYVEFFSYLSEYSDTFESNWNIEDVYGRMDGIANFINTKRQISLGFKIPAADKRQAEVNLWKVSKLIKFLYPAVISTVGAVVDPRSPNGETATAGSNISTAPVLRLKFGNLIQDNITRGGIFGFIVGGVSMKPMMDAGFFTLIESETSKLSGERSDVFQTDPIKVGRKIVEGLSHEIEPALLPKVIDLSFTFKPLHNHTLGSVKTSEKEENMDFQATTFPYGFGRQDFLDEGDRTYPPPFNGPIRTLSEAEQKAFNNPSDLESPFVLAGNTPMSYETYDGLRDKDIRLQTFKGRNRDKKVKDLVQKTKIGRTLRTGDWPSGDGGFEWENE